jgi:hypothetical protein
MGEIKKRKKREGFTGIKKEKIVKIRERNCLMCKLWNCSVCVRFHRNEETAVRHLLCHTTVIFPAVHKQGLEVQVKRELPL